MFLKSHEITLTHFNNFNVVSIIVRSAATTQCNITSTLAQVNV